MNAAQRKIYLRLVRCLGQINEVYTVLIRETI
jgi:hypothetical protein